MKKRILSLMTALALTSAAFASLMPVTVSAATVVKLDPTNASPFNDGEFQGWGTSLCWWANRMGYSESLTKQAADAFFSEDGLGLDIARYNLGGGDDPKHNHITRSDSKVPTYAVPTLDSNGKPTTDADGHYIYTYDWTADENQRNIALAALKANPDLYFEGFSNSPPWFMTISGCSSGATNAGSDNLSSEHFDEFGKYIADVTKHFKEEFGITFESYSPMNEPDTTYWGANSWKQEGAHYSPGSTQSGTIIATRKALDDAGLTDVLVAGMDETDIDKTITNYGKLTAEAKTALGRIDTHTYSGSNRAGAKSTAVSAGKDLWMSEVDGGWDGFGLASRIITDMNGMQPAAWVLWDIVDIHKDSSFQTPDGTYSEKNASLNVTGSMWGVGMADHDTETLELANKYYFFGQFTKYINPGDTIIASSNSTLAAYNKKTGDIKIVALNSGSSDLEYQFDLSAFDSVGAGVMEIRTNNATGKEAEHWKEIADEAALSGNTLTTTLKAGTVTTYVIGDFITVGGSSDSISIGQTVNLTANANADLTKAVWSVSDDSIASVTQDGKLTGKKPGTVTVTVTAGELTGTREISVYFDISGSSKIAVGEEYSYSAGEYAPAVTWSVSDSGTASVTADGKVSAKKEGTFTLTARTAGGIETSMEVTAVDYGKKYENTDYTYVKNIPSATNDFNDGNLNGFETSGSAGLTTDNSGEQVLGVQKNNNNNSGAAESGTARLLFNGTLTGDDEQIINMAFDIYVSNSGGTADINLYDSDYASIMNLHYHDWDSYDITVGATTATETSGAKTYLRNGVNDASGVHRISNGAHIEIYYKRSSGVIKVTIKNNTGTAAAKEYVGKTLPGTDIAGLAYSANFTTWSKPVYADNLVTNIVTGPENFDDVEAPAPSEKPALPDSSELIRLSFDNKDLTSESSYGAASAVGTAKFAEIDGRVCLELDNTRNTAVKLTDANGNPLLSGQKNITVSFKVKPTTSDTSWWFYAAPDDSTQTYQSEKYFGAHTNKGSLNVERYNNSGSRSAMATGTVTVGAWNDVTICVNDGSTTVYVNGKKQSTVSSSVNIADMLGADSVAYIGAANWGDGEYATGYIDDFVIYDYALPSFNAERDGRNISFSSDYTEDMPFMMCVALHDKDGILRDVRISGSGEFTVPDDEKYTVTRYLWKGMVPMTEPVRQTLTDGAYLFVHFVGTESNENQEQIYFSVSQDGSSWTTLNNGSPVLKSNVGEKGVRDPHIIRGEDGKFFLIATDLSIYNRRGDSNRWSTCQTSGSKSIVIWESEDLVNWSEARLVEVADKNAGCTWAPESVYDTEKGQYMVFWASKVSDDNYSQQRIYRSYTSDFKTFTDAEVYIDNGYSTIDTTITNYKGIYYRFTKDEAKSSITMMKSASLSNGWEDVATYTINGVAGNSVTGYEGPTIYRINGEDKWCLLLDYYSKSQGYKPFVTSDITKGEFTSGSDFTFDATYRHGTVMPITSEEYKRLIANEW